MAIKLHVKNTRKIPTLIKIHQTAMHCLKSAKTIKTERKLSYIVQQEKTIKKSKAKIINKLEGKIIFLLVICSSVYATNKDLKIFASET